LHQSIRFPTSKVLKVWRSSTDWRAVLVKALVHKWYVPTLTTAACIACMFKQQEHLKLDCSITTTVLYYCEKVIMIRVKWKAGAYTAAIAGSDAGLLLACTFCNTSLQTLSTRAVNILVSAADSCNYCILQCVEELYWLACCLGESTRSQVICS
jgi:hypothetical protein